ITKCRRTEFQSHLPAPVSSVVIAHASRIWASTPAERVPYSIDAPREATSSCVVLQIDAMDRRRCAAASGV
ncbi:hypothetical protein PENTCL1PPCAC_15603, partial [Pristionchus entomophagus]